MIVSRRIWVVVANSAEAQVWDCEAKETPQRPLSDGRFYNPHQPRWPAQTGIWARPADEAVAFVQAIAAYLDRAARHGLFSALVVAAPDEMLELLLAHVHHDTARRIVRRLPQDLTHQSPAQLAGSLGQGLPAGSRDGPG